MQSKWVAEGEAGRAGERHTPSLSCLRLGDMWFIRPPHFPKAFQWSYTFPPPNISSRHSHNPPRPAHHADPIHYDFTTPHTQATHIIHDGHALKVPNLQGRCCCHRNIVKHAEAGARVALSMVACQVVVGWSGRSCLGDHTPCTHGAAPEVTAGDP